MLWLLGLVGFFLAFCVPKEVAATGPALNTKVATTSSSVGIDCTKKIAFVARRVLSSSTGNGRVKVLNLGVNLKKVDPRSETIDLGHPDYPSGIAVDPIHKLAIVVSGNNGNGGFLDLIDESTTPPALIKGGGAPYPFPPGSDTNSGDHSFYAPGLGQVIYDSIRNVALVSTSDQSISSSDQCSSAGKCTGIAVFDMSSKKFGSIITFATGTTMGGADNFAFNPITDQILAPDDAIEPIIQAVDLNGTQSACTLSDANVVTNSGNDGKPNSDPDTVGVDPKTNIWVIGPGFGSNVKVPVINMNGSSFGTGPGCSLTEGGTPPNSVLVDSFTAGSLAVNPKTHQAFIVGLNSAGAGNDVGLMSLPTKPVVQLNASMIKYVQSSIPNDPDGRTVTAQGFPYTAAIDTCHNLGYVADGSASGGPRYLVQVSLAKLKGSPSKISTSLPSGSCWRSQSVLSCDNGHGVKFFPVVP